MNLFATSLLIVPYGIETMWTAESQQDVLVLLIVPYGIETLNDWQVIQLGRLLIVPYGIETIYMTNLVRHCPKFCVNGNRIQL